MLAVTVSDEHRLDSPLLKANPMNPIVIRLLLGGLLLVAAGLKGHQLATEPVLESGLLHWRPLSVCVVEVEIAIGIWLLSGVYLLAARHVAILWFALLGCVSFWNLVAGVTDCHCFGKLSVEPKWVFLVDFAAVASLLWCRPRTTG